MKKIHLFILSCLFATSINCQDSKWPPIDKSTMDAVYYPRETPFRNYYDGDDRTMTPKMKLVYSRPLKKDRDIFGTLVPYGQEWRMGANEATMITFYQSVDINGTTVPNGTYTVFAIPNTKEWIINFSSQSGIWGGENRNKALDVAIITVPTEMAKSSVDALSMTFQEVDDQTVNMVIQWDKTRVSVPIGMNPVEFDGADKSPMDMAHYPGKSAYVNYLEGEEANIKPMVQVIYGRPSKNGRDIFGELLKEGSVWRLGANESTEIVVYQNTTIGGQEVKRGRYALFAKLNKGSWDLIFSKDYPTWGSYNRDESKDTYTINVKTSTDTEVLEQLSIIFEEKDVNSADMIIGWDKTRAVVPMKF